MEIRLSDSFTYKKLIRYVLPCIAMMIMTSIYSIVDGYFVSNIIGKNPFAAVNLVMPVLMAISAIGFMIGTGGSALTSYYMGLGEKKKANEVFSMLVWLIIISSCIVAVIGFVFMPQIVELLGASDTIRSDAILYGRILILSEPFFMLQNSFQSFLTTAEKQNLGLLVSVLAGITNMVLDFLLMFVFRLGIAGAAAATVCGQIIGSVVPLIYFATNTTGSLKLTKAKFDWKCIWKACGNGSSEMLTNLSTSLVSVVYNLNL
ncbi:MAG: MATE family efflux transporter [Coprococcus sp.]